ncbi:hypothetical protein BP00DRAFT_333603 [Aspergillus indologenus CBS 114.80]|uniref:Uncharacterized protein n=1 Tax=Aspergillus indologenus CBS 114.80 TaxID=1450541 RepID=A0A2V5IGW7_9EURO|nr:hypothetical protein BP00DRAFT_333603 [Aspergillus indologenus CBS 114.80]
MGAASGTWSYLAFASGASMCNQKIKRHVQEIGKDAKPQEVEVPERRSIEVILLPFNAMVLKEPNVFRSFQKLLFDTRDYFGTCLRSRRWEPNGQGLFARSPERRAALKTLSCFHNMIVDAISLLCHKICQSIVKCANGLQTDDCRRKMLASLEDLNVDAAGHLYIAFDAYRRSLWPSSVKFQQTRIEHIKSIFSYNQASFPRAEDNGSYDLFRDMTPDSVFKIRKDSDDEEQLGEFSHESICLWHTAIRWLKLKGDFAQMVKLGEYLSLRWHTFGPRFESNRDEQLNTDASLTFYLLGVGYKACRDFGRAMEALQNAVVIRRKGVCDERWDATNVATLRKLDSVALILELTGWASWCDEVLKTTYLGLVIEETRRRNRDVPGDCTSAFSM